MNKENLLEIASNFKLTGTPIESEICESGHINRTYEIRCKEGENKKKYILQYVNTKVFPNLKELMKNIEKVTQYIKDTAKKNNEYHDRITINLIETKQGDKPAIYNENWRMEEFIENTETYLKTDDLEVLYEARKICWRISKIFRWISSTRFI